MSAMSWLLRRSRGARLALDEYLTAGCSIGCGRSRGRVPGLHVSGFRCPDEGACAFARELADSGKYLMGTINNEVGELNAYRIEKFGLRRGFSRVCQFVLCGVRKPEEGIYRLALDLTQQAPEECCFIDDRALNLEMAKRLGMHTIEMDGAEQLRRD